MIVPIEIVVQQMSKIFFSGIIFSGKMLNMSRTDYKITEISKIELSYRVHSIFIHLLSDKSSVSRILFTASEPALAIFLAYHSSVPY